jgi:ATP-dependent DNA helicase RecG
LTNRTSTAERARTREGLADGSVDLVVGTHALLTDDVRFKALGVAVIDEQHRFGVEQRAALRSKGRDAASGAGADPDVLVMTATPIPRTAAMVVFGDLDMTLLDELPARGARRSRRVGRALTPTTPEFGNAYEARGSGRPSQPIVVCPLVEGSENASRPSATAEKERLGQTVLAGLCMGLLHGQLKAADKERVMSASAAGSSTSSSPPPSSRWESTFPTRP